MPEYTIQLKPDSLTKLYWVDLGDETHVELNRIQLLQLVELRKRKSNGVKFKVGKGMHPKTLAPTETLSYDDSGQLDSVLNGLKQVIPGIGIIKSGGSRRRGIRKRRRSIRKSSSKSSRKRS
jgi:hypothetical protein